MGKNSFWEGKWEVQGQGEEGSWAEKDANRVPLSIMTLDNKKI